MESSKIDSRGKFVTGGFDRQWQWRGSEGVKFGATSVDVMEHLYEITIT